MITPDAVEGSLTAAHPIRFVSDGDPKTVAVPRGDAARVKADYAARAIER